jgi:aspartyl-tRNA(Asn)/glutamyl-tRNA(Gln) amidotransferase subunit A
LEILTSYDEKDSLSLKPRDNEFTKALQDDVKGLRIGVPKLFLYSGLAPEVEKSIYSAIETFRNKGAVIEEFELSNVEHSALVYHILSAAEASSNLARFDGVKYGYRPQEFNGYDDLYYKSRSNGFGMEVKKKIVLGNFILSAENFENYYVKALKVRRLLKDSFTKAFEKYDLILGPTTATTAPKFGEGTAGTMGRYMGDFFTIPANLIGIPAISIPCGLDQNGLPVGMQLMGDYFKETTIIQAAYSFEQTRLLEKRIL